MLVQHSSKLAMQVSPLTLGRKLGWICRASSFLQLIGLSHLCLFISSLPPGPLPSRLPPSLNLLLSRGNELHWTKTMEASASLSLSSAELYPCSQQTEAAASFQRGGFQHSTSQLPYHAPDQE
ncbi:Os07g0680800 [Oryza sativa Japonica Group]|uniref:Os07g0680800 protein n=1 Tax=Oryza sativa subsp. japonica TaxID=39947 RepID=A0A0P0XAH0_ORYSJ|nr:hypothetical protein EE612_041404 [Oryza sativa]BAT03239.1 Os07g0680800 [Oryza sativa Japonica Group]